MDVYSASLKGIRDQNEDKHCVILNNDKKDNKIAPVNLYSVFDGHGGRYVSSFLANNIPHIFTHKQVTYPLNKGFVCKVFDHLQNILRTKHHNHSHHCGSTALIAIQFKKDDSDYINILNLGDSRGILCRDNIGIPLTKDHKPHWPEEKKRITQLGGNIKMDRDGEWRIQDLSVSRAMGDLDSEKYVSHTPDIFRYKIEKNDKFMVLACDGLWDVLSNQDVINFILDVSYDENLLYRKNKHINVAKLLAEHAIKSGSGDNVSILVIFFK
jgi:serine/threonine protein phosphatase PrpC